LNVSSDGDPSDQEVCDFAEQSTNLPNPEDYEITIIINNPSHSNFPGSTSKTTVLLGARGYTVEDLASTDDLQTQLGATSIITSTSA